MKRTPTYAHIDHFRDAMEVGHIACAESIQFEFKCRDDRDAYAASFEAIVKDCSPCDPVEMRKRLSNIRKSADKVDARISSLRQRVLSPQDVKAA